MSTSDGANAPTDFDDWVASEFAARGAFTSLVVLIGVDGGQIQPLCSTYFNVVGDTLDWEEITILFAGSGMDWGGAAFLPANAGAGGPMDNPSARLQLRALEERLAQQGLALPEGELFDRQGRRMRVPQDRPL